MILSELPIRKINGTDIIDKYPIAEELKCFLITEAAFQTPATILGKFLDG
jgi:hypothetical protein